MTDLSEWFPERSTQEVLAAVDEFWELKHLTDERGRSAIFPFPRQPIPCPICGWDRPELLLYRSWMWPRRWLFFQRSGGPHAVRGRADVSFKCHRCSLDLTFGVPIADGLPISDIRVWEWREVRALTEMPPPHPSEWP